LAQQSVLNRHLFGEGPAVHRFFQFAAFLALFAVAFVLITPAPDELPCTAPHGKLPVFALPAAAISMFQLITFDLPSLPKSVPSFSGTTLLSFNCAFLC
jgi:hypothetical protein